MHIILLIELVFSLSGAYLHYCVVCLRGETIDPIFGTPIHQIERVGSEEEACDGLGSVSLSIPRIDPKAVS